MDRKDKKDKWGGEGDLSYLSLFERWRYAGGVLILVIIAGDLIGSWPKRLW